MRKAVGCRPSPTFEKSVLQRAAGRKIGSEERTERPKLGFRHVVPEDGRICHTLELSVYMPGWSCAQGTGRYYPYQGLTVLVDGRLAAHAPTLQKLQLQL